MTTNKNIFGIGKYYDALVCKYSIISWSQFMDNSY